MELNDLIQQWDNAVDVIQQPAAHETGQQEATLEVRTKINAGSLGSLSGWRKQGDKQVCWYDSEGRPTYECESCTDTWTDHPC